MPEPRKSHKICFLFDKYALCSYNTIKQYRARIRKKQARIGENLDFLSFLALIADYCFSFAKTFAGFVAALIILMIARCLPSRIRRYFSACATAALCLALLKSPVEQLTFFTVKASVVYVSLLGLTAFAVLFFVYIATYIANGYLCERVFVDRYKAPYSRAGVALRGGACALASNAFLQISPISLQ